MRSEPDAHGAGEARAHEPESPFRLSAAVPPPDSQLEVPLAHTSRPFPGRLFVREPDTEFELIVDEAELAAAISASPEELRGIREIEEFKKDKGDYGSWVTMTELSLSSAVAIPARELAFREMAQRVSPAFSRFFALSITGHISSRSRFW